MAIKLNISSEELLNTKFSAAPRGYEPLEVDTFLDRILRDYRTIESNHLVDAKEIDRYKKQIQELEEANKKLEIANAKYEAKLKDIGDNKNVTVENIDLIKRIRALEKALYKAGINPASVK
ncbi:MAG: DivIVA domain-containing protein [Bacilli bacterium]|mgnify:CR=1|nr:DivIVA domain-containing protein [Bacilli bacterium]